MPSSKEFYDLNRPFIYKTIRDDERGFWDEFVEGVVYGHKKPLRSPARALNRWILRLERLRPGKDKREYEAVRTVNKPPLWSEDEKKFYSSIQSTSYASPSTGYHSGYFGQESREGLVGIRVAVDDTLISRILMYDGGTQDRNYQTSSRQDALREKDRLLEEEEWFTSLEELSIAGKKDQGRYSEVMARLTWAIKPSSQIVIFEDTLGARISAQIRAKDLQLSCIERQKQLVLPVTPSEDVLISFYKPLTYYSKEQQEEDIKHAKENPSLKYDAIVLEALCTNNSISHIIKENEVNYPETQDELMFNVLKSILKYSRVTRCAVLKRLFEDSFIPNSNIINNIKKVMGIRANNFGRLLGDLHEITATIPGIDLDQFLDFFEKRELKLQRQNIFRYLPLYRMRDLSVSAICDHVYMDNSYNYGRIMEYVDKSNKSYLAKQLRSKSIPLIKDGWDIQKVLLGIDLEATRFLIDYDPYIFLKVVISDVCFVGRISPLSFEQKRIIFEKVIRPNAGLLIEKRVDLSGFRYLTSSEEYEAFIEENKKNPQASGWKKLLLDEREVRDKISIDTQEHISKMLSLASGRNNMLMLIERISNDLCMQESHESSRSAIKLLCANICRKINNYSGDYNFLLRDEILSLLDASKLEKEFPLCKKSTFVYLKELILRILTLGHYQMSPSPALIFSDKISQGFKDNVNIMPNVTALSLRS